MEVNKKLFEYIPNLKKLNDLLNDLDRAKYEHEEGDTHFLCDRYGDCESLEEPEGKKDGYTSECFCCGAELILYKGNFYHYSIENDIKDFKKNYEVYNTHNYKGSVYGVDPVSEEQERVFELEEEIKKFVSKLKRKNYHLTNE